MFQKKYLEYTEIGGTAPLGLPEATALEHYHIKNLL